MMYPAISGRKTFIFGRKTIVIVDCGEQNTFQKLDYNIITCSIKNNNEILVFQNRLKKIFINVNDFTGEELVGRYSWQ
jgi:hypothetical protein